MGYVYVKKVKPVSAIPIPKLTVTQKKLIALGLLMTGVYLFGSAVYPIISFQLEYSSKFGQVTSPLAAQTFAGNNILGEVSTDYTQLNNWFNEDKATTQNSNSVASPQNVSATYSIAIPEIKIDEAIVTVGSMDLKKSLIQYPQTALPGQLGSAVVFGHSVLPQFFNPKSYLTIFSTLYKLKAGSEIFVEYDRVKYKYVVEDMYEVSPNDLSVLEQHFDARYMVLITCSPPGTYLRRLVVKARIVDI